MFANRIIFLLFCILVILSYKLNGQSDVGASDRKSSEKMELKLEFTQSKNYSNKPILKSIISDNELLTVDTIGVFLDKALLYKDLDALIKISDYLNSLEVKYSKKSEYVTASEVLSKAFAIIDERDIKNLDTNDLKSAIELYKKINDKSNKSKFSMHHYKNLIIAIKNDLSKENILKAGPMNSYQIEFNNKTEKTLYLYVDGVWNHTFTIGDRYIYSFNDQNCKMIKVNDNTFNFVMQKKICLSGSTTYIELIE